MDYGSGIGIAQRLAIEKQLLREEKYIVHALKTIKEERFGLQREGTDMLCLLQEVLRQGKSSTTPQQESQAKAEQSTIAEPPAAQPDVQNPTPKPSSFAEEFNLASLDDGIGNDAELNLTVPSHSFYDRLSEQEEFEEMEAEDDYEIEMSMLMNGSSKTE